MKELANKIVEWLEDYAEKSNRKAWVVGVSGGVDSALVSTLCAMTGMPTHCVVLPCQSKANETDRGNIHIGWMEGTFNNIHRHAINLTDTFDMFFQETSVHYSNELAYANAKSRLRMVALYQVATCVGGLVVGTGNKVEDFGVGFFTKYGDGGVDISPIGDLTKTEVRQMCRELGVLPELSEAVPTDGLWDDARTDESQLGASYEELEWAMDYLGDGPTRKTIQKQLAHGILSPRELEVLKTYHKWHNAGAHKLLPIPTFKRW
jgi:NAD+ synthase